MTVWLLCVNPQVYSHPPINTNELTSSHGGVSAAQPSPLNKLLYAENSFTKCYQADLSYPLAVKKGQWDELLNLTEGFLATNKAPGQKVTLDGSWIYQACGKRVQIASSSLYTSSTCCSSSAHRHCQMRQMHIPLLQLI